jgi:ABC-type glycerol-3-phosphate transport system permease component
MSKRLAFRRIALAAVAGVGVAVWVFPVIWGLLTSFKTERDVLAYPPVWLFKPTLDNYREVIFGASSILPNLWSSFVVATSATILTMLIAIPAAYALGRLRYPAKRASGFYVLVTQMLPPIGLIIPYYLVLQKLGALDTYSGLSIIYLTFALPFAIWLMVSYFEDVPFEMEEAALLDRAGRCARCGTSSCRRCAEASRSRRSSCSSTRGTSSCSRSCSAATACARSRWRCSTSFPSSRRSGRSSRRPRCSRCCR